MMKRGKRITVDNPTFGMVQFSAPEAFWYPDRHEKAKSELKKRGIRIIEGKTAHMHRFYLVERPQVVVADFYEMLLREDVDAIMCVAGGSCANKLLPFLNFELMKENWKPFVGMCNMVALMLPALLHGMVSLHSPYSIWGYGLPGTPTEYTYNNLINILKGYTGKLPTASQWRVYREGQGSGQLIGGHLRTIGTIVGTKYCPAELFDDKILIIEELNRTYQAMDAMLTHLRLLGAFENLRGVIVGKLVNCHPPEKDWMEVEDFLKEAFEGYDFPIIYDCDFGHVSENLCLPLGCELKMIADKNKPELILLEPGVE